MAPNLDLILLSFLYGAFLSCVILLLATAALFGLLLAFASALLSVAALDLYDSSLLLGRCLSSAKADLELGCVLLLYLAMRSVAPIFLTSRPIVERRIEELNDIARRVVDHYHLL